jgi:hypothetical protein
LTIPLKIKIFTWFFHNKVIFTKDNLAKRKENALRNAQKRAKREAVRQAHKAVRRMKRERKELIKAQMEGPSTLDDIDPWWDDLFSLHPVEFVGLQLQNRRLDVLI